MELEEADMFEDEGGAPPAKERKQKAQKLKAAAKKRQRSDDEGEEGEEDDEELEPEEVAGLQVKTDHPLHAEISVHMWKKAALYTAWHVNLWNVEACQLQCFVQALQCMRLPMHV